MACNLPVVTTPFGGLSDCLKEGDGLYFAKSQLELMEKFELARWLAVARTRAKVVSFTWGRWPSGSCLNFGSCAASDRRSLP